MWFWLESSLSIHPLKGILSTLWWLWPFKTTLRYHFTPVRMAKINKTVNNVCWRGCRERGSLLHCWWECKLVQPLWKKVWRFLKKLKIELPYDPAIALLGIYPKDTDIGVPGWLSGLKPLPSAQVMIPGPWDRTSHQTLCSVGSLICFLSLCLLVISVCQINKLKKYI